MGVPKRLTEMQKRFAELIVWGGPNGPVSQTEAAKLAGYKLKQEKFRKFEVTYEGHLAELSRIKEEALKKGSFSSAVNAETNRGKAAGLYIERKIIKTGKLEDLSELELEAKMKKILDDYSQILDVTPEKIEDKDKH